MLLRRNTRPKLNELASNLEEALSIILKASTQHARLSSSTFASLTKVATKAKLHGEAGKLFLDSLMTEQAAYGLHLLEKTRLLDLIMPELAQNRGVEQGGFHHLDVLNHSIEALRQVILSEATASPELRLAALLHDVGKASTFKLDSLKRRSFLGHDKVGADISKVILERLNLAVDSEKVAALVQYHMLPLPKNTKEAERFVRKRKALLPDLLHVMLADRQAARGSLSSPATRQRYQLGIARVLEVLNEVPVEEVVLLTGHDLIAQFGFAEGPFLGELLSFLKAAQKAGDINSKEEAFEAARHYAEQQGFLQNKN